MRLAYACLVLAFGCGSNAGGGDDQPPADGKQPDGGDPCGADPASCPGDDGTFVSAARGDDGNPGSKAMPLKTIGAGIAKAKGKGGAQSVFVAQGTYPEKVTLAPGVSVHGGYECNTGACGWTRDLAAFETTIANQDFEGVLAGAGITSTTLLAGFTIRGKDGMPAAAPGGAGVTIAGSSPTVRGNRIFGGNVLAGGPTAADRSLGVAVRGTGGALAKIENNEIVSGTAPGLSAAILLENVGGPATATIAANTLQSGQARRSDGIAAFGSGAATTITGNEIFAGTSMGGTSNGIELTSAATITRNRINVVTSSVGACMNATTWCAGIATNGATATITNNIVYGPKGFRTAGVFMTETEQPAGTVILNANYLNGGGQGGAGSGTVRNESAAVVVAIGSCNNCGLKGAVGRVRNNILDGGINLNRYGVREDPAQGRTTSVELLDSNDIWFAEVLSNRNDVLYREITQSGAPIDTKSIFVLDGWSSPPTMNNQNEDPMLSATYHLADRSPCVDSGTTTEAPADDFEGETRPSGPGVDIGPDEKH
ncbi:MAG: right-handed parallel beta-helix repeat-containing protein [Myxococcales bacterium]|nr:right-handed parallel beta-helix repeat-containing protein [Myxococcales bacterium]